jgi:2'-deoxynucleoside 5'-phosphate N-hydrolase
MNVYFSCSITGGRRDQVIYQALVQALLADGHFVPTAHLSSSDVMALEEMVDPQETYARDVAWVNECDALVAEVSTPSHGVGYEVALALGLGKPVICCYQQGRRVSKMITGNTSPTLRLAEYCDSAELIVQVRSFLRRIGPQD